MSAVIDVGQVTVYPLLRYRDPERAFGWLARAFGFREHDIARNEAGEAFHAELNLGAGMIMISPEREERPVSGTQEVYIALTDIDAHYERASAAGVEITRPIADLPYGSREYSARDLEGNAWHFGTYRPVIAR